MASIKTREEVQKLLEKLLGSENVYFNRPENMKLEYPCIIYSRKGYVKRNADDIPYKLDQRYDVLYIYNKVSGSELVDKLVETPAFVLDREYISDGLYHASFLLHIY